MLFPLTEGRGAEQVRSAMTKEIQSLPLDRRQASLTARASSQRRHATARRRVDLDGRDWLTFLIDSQPLPGLTQLDAPRNRGELKKSYAATSLGSSSKTNQSCSPPTQALTAPSG